MNENANDRGSEVHLQPRGGGDGEKGWGTTWGKISFVSPAEAQRFPWNIFSSSRRGDDKDDGRPLDSLSID